MTDVAVRERPIIFSTPMIRRIMDRENPKTQTRRVVKWEPLEEGFDPLFSGVSAGHYCTGAPESGHVLYSRRRDGVWEQRTKRAYCPFGRPGDQLWVREKHSLYKGSSTPAGIGDATYCCFPDGSQIFKSGDYHHWDKPVTSKWPDGHRWRSSIHMPRWASRITLELTDVRVERLQQITDADAIAEAATRRGTGGRGDHWSMDWSDVGKLSRYASGVTHQCPQRPLTEWDVGLSTPRWAFANLWEKINGKREGCRWNDSPWVFVVSFRRIESSR